MSNPAWLKDEPPIGFTNDEVGALREMLVDEPMFRPPPLTKTEEAEQLLPRDQLFAEGSAFKRTVREEIVGIDNILGEIDEIIHWLRHSDVYGRFGSRLQPGVIFSGCPGTGKTLVSRWIASASDALFVNVRDFFHKGALFTDRDIQDLFHRARATYAQSKRPIVLFWDEFENAARERGDGATTPEQRSTVSQLTAELDGIHGKNEGILLIGCTNYSATIDEALKRRGRMGLEIDFYAPNRAGKELILSHYLSRMTTSKAIDVHTLSFFFTKENTAADIEEACVEAWRNGVRRFIEQPSLGEPTLNQDDLIKVFIKQLVGPPTTFTLAKAERLPIAIHECGHAIVALTYSVPLRLVTVQPGKKALGRVMTADPQEYIGSTDDTLNRMRVGFGGIAAERTAQIPAITGAAGDIKNVNLNADHLVTALGTGTRTGMFSMTSLERRVEYSTLNPQISGGVLERADADVKDLLLLVEKDACFATDRVGKANLLKIATEVDKRVTLTGIQFHDLYVEVCGFEPELA